MQNLRWLKSALFIFFIFPLYCISQDLDRKVSLTVQNGTLEDAIHRLDELGVRFSYNPDVLPLSTKINIKIRNRPLQWVFKEVFTRNGVDFMIVENQVVLKPSVPKADDHSSEKPPKNDDPKYTLSGYLRDKLTGEVLIGAYAYAKGTSLGTTTNAYGFYSLTLPEGDYQMVFSFIGYHAVEQQVFVDKNQKISADLETSQTDIQEVEIIADDNNSMIENNQLSEMKLTPKALSQLPGIAGDIDLIKSLQSVPGVKSFGDGSSMFYVRGGNSDQNLILIDEAPVYNPSHLFGFISALAPDAINDIEVYKGDFPANYGGRLSSVINVKAKEGNMKRIGFGGNLGLFTSDLTFEGPFKKDKASFFLSGRRSNLNWLKVFIPGKNKFKINFYDINSKFNVRINTNNRLLFTFYWGKDIFSRAYASSLYTFGIDWDNLVGSMRWNHIFNQKLFSNTTAYYSRYNYYLYIYREADDYWKSSISNMSLKSDFTWYINPSNTFKTGFDITAHQSDPGNVHFSDSVVQKHVLKNPLYTSMEYVFYAGNEQKVSDKISFRYGIRLPIWTNLGPHTIYSFDGEYNVSDTSVYEKGTTYSIYVVPQPRFSFKYSINSQNAIKVSYSRTAQFLQLLSNSISPFNTLDVWVPSGPNIKPQQADQFALGYFRQLFESRLDISVEAFYKQFYNQIEYEDHANMLYNPYIEGELRFGKAWSYGAELLVRKKYGKLTGWVAYTWSRVLKRIDGVNDNLVYPATHDRPHDISINVAFDTEKRFMISASWIYLTGAAITTPVGFFYYNGYSIPIYEGKNNDRLPDYHRLDIAMTLRLNKPQRRFKHSLVMTVYNVYARKNPFTVHFSKIIDDNGRFIIPSDLDGETELVPSAISVAGMIPSLNYTFKF